MSVDILTVPGTPHALEARFRQLFPESERVQGPLSELTDPCRGLCTATRAEIFSHADQATEDWWSVDRWTADRCALCGWCVPWSHVVSGASARAVVDDRDVRLCALCTAERAR